MFLYISAFHPDICASRAHKIHTEQWRRDEQIFRGINESPAHNLLPIICLLRTIITLCEVLIKFCAECMTELWKAEKLHCHGIRFWIFLTRWHTLKNLILCYRHHNYITFYCFWYPHLQAKTQAHISKVLLDEWRPRFPFPQAKPSAAWWHLLSFHSYPHKLPALRLNTWHRTLREISFVVSGTISSTFKWHQTGGSLFQAYKWRNVQVLHLIHRQSQIADRPRTEFSKWFIMFFIPYSNGWPH